MKITDVKTHVVKMPSTMPWVFVSVETDEGRHRLGRMYRLHRVTLILKFSWFEGLKPSNQFVIGIDAS